MKRLLSPFPRNRPPTLLMFEQISKAAVTEGSRVRTPRGQQLFSDSKKAATVLHTVTTDQTAIPITAFLRVV